MKRILFYIRGIFYAAAGLAAFFVLLGVLDTFRPLVMGLRLAGNRSLGTNEICAALMKGDYEAASSSIALKKARRELRFADTITWLGGKGPSPYVEIPRSQLFSELPQDQGPLRSCTQPSSANLAGDQLSARLALGYEKSRVGVTLRYSAGLFSQKLQRIEISKPDPITPATPPPGELERRMLGFMKKLDEGAAR